MKKIFIDISIKSIKSYENSRLILASYVLRVPRESWTCEHRLLHSITIDHAVSIYTFISYCTCLFQRGEGRLVNPIIEALSKNLIPLKRPQLNSK